MSSAKDLSPDTMLAVFDLYVLEKIFFNAGKISIRSRQIYINCIVFWFRDKPLKIQYNISFDIPKSIFDYEKHINELNQLHKVGLVVLNENTITFPAVWYKLINQNHFNSDRQALINEINIFKPVVETNESMIEICCMKNRLSKKQVKFLLDLFFKEQAAAKTIYSSEQEVIKHFINWIKYNKEQSPTKSASSSSKILGLE